MQFMLSEQYCYTEIIYCLVCAITVVYLNSERSLNSLMQ